MSARPNRPLPLFLGASLTALALGGAAHAETAAPSAVDEVIVIADKREVNLQKAPAAISVIGAEQLDRNNITDALALNGRAPGLSVTQSESFQRLVSIRGVGFSTPQNGIAQPGVALHIDGVYVVGTTALTQDFFDVERLDVLRGPQGTVYGQNAEGGTINVITKAPDLSGPSGVIDVAAGNYNFFNARAAVNLPLSDSLALRVTAIHLQHDGFSKSTLLSGYELDDADQTGVRAQLLWKPTDDFEATLSSQYFTANQNDNALKNILDPEADPRRVTQDYPGTFDTRQFLQSLTLAKGFGWGKLTSISSYQHLKYVMALDNDRLDFAHYTPHDIMPYSGQRTNAWTQEINLTSNPSDTFDWIVGAFALRSSSKGSVVEYYTRPGESTPVIFAPYPDGSTPSNLGYQSSSTPNRRSYSAYGQGTYHLGPDLRLTGGLRYTHDRSFSDNSSYFGASKRVAQSTDTVSGKVGVDYDLSPANLLYANVTRGFKPGGSNLSTSPVLGALTFQRESVWAYEVGTKNRFFDDRVTLNGAAFYYDYRNYQFSQDDPVPYQGGISNIPKARIYGAEAELTAKLPSDVLFEGSVTALSGSVRSTYKALATVVSSAL
jgi:iron complex outermembrane receptor protein